MLQASARVSGYPSIFRTRKRLFTEWFTGKARGRSWITAKSGGCQAFAVCDKPALSTAFVLFNANPGDCRCEPEKDLIISRFETSWCKFWEMKEQQGFSAADPQPIKTDERLETPKQLAARVGLSERQIRELIRTRQLEYVQRGCRGYAPVRLVRPAVACV